MWSSCWQLGLLPLQTPPACRLKKTKKEDDDSTSGSCSLVSFQSQRCKHRLDGDLKIILRIMRFLYLYIFWNFFSNFSVCIMCCQKCFHLNTSGLCTAAARELEEPARPNTAGGKHLGMFSLLSKFFYTCQSSHDCNKGCINRLRCSL